MNPLCIMDVAYRLRDEPGVIRTRILTTHKTLPDYLRSKHPGKHIILMNAQPEQDAVHREGWCDKCETYHRILKISRSQGPTMDNADTWQAIRAR